MIIPIELWEIICVFVPRNPIYYSRLAGICKNSRVVFSCEPLWKVCSDKPQSAYTSYDYELWAIVAQIQDNEPVGRVSAKPQSGYELPFLIIASTSENRNLYQPIPQLKDYDFMTRAVKVHGSALVFSPFLGDRALVLLAVETWPEIIERARRFAVDKQVVLEAVRRKGSLLSCVPALQGDCDVVAAAIANDATAARWANLRR